MTDEASPVCVWERPNPLGVSWVTQCDRYVDIEENPEDHGYKWCPYCGGRLYNAETIDMREGK